MPFGLVIGVFMDNGEENARTFLSEQGSVFPCGKSESGVNGFVASRRVFRYYSGVRRR